MRAKDFQYATDNAFRKAKFKFLKQCRKQKAAYMAPELEGAIK